MIQISENAFFNETTGNITVNMNGSGSYVNVDSNAGITTCVGTSVVSGAISATTTNMKKENNDSLQFVNHFPPFKCATYKSISNTIKDINIIVPGKVMVVTFNDDKQEKLVCQKEDHFSLRFGCFIAIAKHLYKDTYTPEGIEAKATEMSYQIHYVKIVNKALKNYSKKCDEKAKEKRLEAEKKETAERKKAKREAYKERRKARLEAERNESLKAERAEMVDIIAEAIKKSKE